jgi:transglutaminase-like putative cysteine protease
VPVDLGYLYFALCVLSASAANQRTLAFYAGLSCLAGWALWTWRSPRFSAFWWAPLVAAAAVAGYGGHIVLHQLQQTLEQTAFDYIFSLVRRDADPFRITTAIGHLGNLKFSDRTVLRVEPREGLAVPFLLREATYDVYNSSTWLASGAGFTAVQPDADGQTWKFATGRGTGERVTVSAYLDRGRGVLALPGGAFELERLSVVSVRRNRLGAVKVEEGLGLITYTARFGPDGPLDGPPIDADLRIPAQEAAVIAPIASELGLAGVAPGEAVKRVEGFFRQNFKYSLWRRERPRHGTALGEFLQISRAGHCEYFASATVLLLRAAGVPARYAVGYSVQEWSRLERRWIARARHGHSWALAYVDGAWRDVDTTPSIWADAERDEASIFEPLRDLWSWGGFVFSRWRWSEGESRVGEYAPWLLIPLVLLLVWRLYSRRHVRRGAGQTRGSRALPLRPGHDSEFYLIARRLEGEGRGRRPTEPASTWIDRIQAPELHPIVALHYQYRFDPAGLDEAGRAALREGAQAWLRDRESAAAAAGTSATD